MATIQTTAPPTFPTVTLDLYAGIHKTIRAELFAVTLTAGRTDPSNAADVEAVAAHIGAVADLLTGHAGHEDVHIDGPLREHCPEMAEQIITEHEVLDRRFCDVSAWSVEAVHAPADVRRHEMHTVYMELASFTSAYLAHQDFEERIAMPALDRAIGFDGVLAIHQAIIAAIPPDEMARTLAVMLPAMNVDDRAEILGGMQAGAPPEVFEGVWSLAGSVLVPPDMAALARRLGR